MQCLRRGSLPIDAPAIWRQLLTCGPAFGQSVPPIVEPIDENQRVVLAGNTRGEAQPEFDRGPVDDAFPMNGMQLPLRRSPEREQAAEALADDLNRATK